MLHPDARALLDFIQTSGVPPTHTLAPVDARRFYRERRAVTQPDPPPVAQVQDLQAEGPHGPIPLRLYKPLLPGAAGGPAPLPVLVYFTAAAGLSVTWKPTTPCAGNLPTELAVPCSQWITAWAQNTVFHVPSTIASPPPVGAATKPGSLGWTPHGWPSVATALAAIWPLWWRLRNARRVIRRYVTSC